MFNPERWLRHDAVTDTLLVRYVGGADLREHHVVKKHLSNHGAVHGKPVGGISHRIHVANKDRSLLLAQQLANSGLVEFIEPDQMCYAQRTPNDPDFIPGDGSGFYTGYGWPSAWDICTGDPSVSVAVLGTGCDVTHEDLASKIVNPWSTVSNSTNVSPPDSHDTTCASIIGAATNNGVGGVGVAWDCMITPIQCGTTGSNLAQSDIATGIDWIRLNATAKVISCSYAPLTVGWGGNAAGATLALAIAMAWSAGITCYFSAADSNTESDAPTGAPQMIVVSMTNGFRVKASPSNDGTSVNIAACQAGFGAQAGGGYVFFNGCSNACPLTAGLHALMLSAKPSASASEIIYVMHATSFPTTGFAAPIRAINPWAAVNAIKRAPNLMGAVTG